MVSRRTRVVFCVRRRDQPSFSNANILLFLFVVQDIRHAAEGYAAHAAVNVLDRSLHGRFFR